MLGQHVSLECLAAGQCLAVATGNSETALPAIQNMIRQDAATGMPQQTLSLVGVADEIGGSRIVAATPRKALNAVCKLDCAATTYRSGKFGDARRLREQKKRGRLRPRFLPVRQPV